MRRGEYSVAFSDFGTGYSSFGPLALTRGDVMVQGGEGFHLYVRDLDRGVVWSSGILPTRATPSWYRVRRSNHRIDVARRDHDIDLTLTLVLTGEGNAELRRYTLRNQGHTARRLALTTYAEVVLNTPSGDAGHPAFSKLFVQTEFDTARGAIIARRRQRSPDDATLWLAHAFVGHGELASTPLDGVETDRLRFIGRGRTLAAPRAIDVDATLSGTTGNVLDPVVAMRREVEIGPGAEVTLTALLGAGHDRAAVDRVIARYANAAAIDVEIEGAESDASFVNLLLPGLPSADDPYRAAGEGDSPTDVAAGDAELDALELANGFGGFTRDGREYVIRLPAGASGPVRPPLPWVNVIANERVGFIVSESGAANTWCANSRENRLTPWFNDPVSDPHGEALFLRDEDRKIFWSPTAGPTPAPGAYEVRHGLGYTRFLHESFGLTQEVVQFVPRQDPVKITRLRITNQLPRTRRLSVWSFSHLVLGVMPSEGVTQVHLARMPRGIGLTATNHQNGEFSERVAFAAAGGAFLSVHVSGDRRAFLGECGSISQPRALRCLTTLDDNPASHGDPCAALQGVLELAGGTSADIVFLLGEGDDGEHARTLAERYLDVEDVDVALRNVEAYWQDLVGAVQVQTPSPAIDLMVNGWLPYQNLSCRMFGRSAFYQSGGAFGFRDQLQDAAALIHHDSSITRRQIVLHASHQFVEGDVLHWWHPPLGKGIRTRFSDDLLWLPFVTAYYVETTGDTSILDEEARFLSAPSLSPGEDEVFLIPEESSELASVFEHCARVIDRSLTRGAHALPLMGTGDWNDGMNRVGREGRGESVWLGFFLATVLDAFTPIAESRGETARVATWREYRKSLGSALNSDGWDGSWYRRAFYDDGTPLGAADGDECRIDAIAQAWSVISRVAPPERATMSLDAMERELVDEDARIIRLLAPAFDRTPHDPGYIKGYLPGVRENGGQYTHGALWAVRALAEAGRHERAARLLEMLSPVSHADSKDRALVYMVEPYVIAADVYGVAPHVGRGGWTWYTGSAGWMARIALESVLGVRVFEGTKVRVSPCIPANWSGFNVRLRLPNGASFELFVVRHEAPTSLVIDGKATDVRPDAIEFAVSGGGAHRVELALGPDYTLTYRQ